MKPLELQDNFKCIYKILRTLEKCIDIEEFDAEKEIGYEKLGISKMRWMRYIEMINDSGYVKGARVEYTAYGELMVDVENICITLKGLEYLQENSIMQMLYRQAKGLVDTASNIKSIIK